MALRHGARQVYDLIEDTEEEAIALLDRAAQDVHYDPAHAKRLMNDAIGKIQKARRIREQELTPLVQRAAPIAEKDQELSDLRKTVDDLAERLARLERGAAIRLERR